MGKKYESHERIFFFQLRKLAQWAFVRNDFQFHYKIVLWRVRRPTSQDIHLVPVGVLDEESDV